MSSRKYLEIIGIASTYIGTVIGAGFASGQEILQFFVAYGGIGLAGILTAGFLFALLGYKLLILSWDIGAEGFKDILTYLYGKRLGTVMEIIISLSLFGIFTIMLAGAGTLSVEYYQLSFNIGLLCLVLLSAFTVLCGVDGIVAANFIVTPILALVTILTSVSSALHHSFDTSIFALPVIDTTTPASNWLISCLLYVSYNVVFSAAILSPLGAKTKDPDNFQPACLISGFVLALLAGLIFATMLLHHPEVWSYEVPMLSISIMQSIIHHTVYALTLVIAIYTSSIASLYACVDKLSRQINVGRPLALFITIIAAIFLSRLGFSKLISLIYPVFGYSSIIFSMLLLWKTTLRKYI